MAPVTKGDPAAGSFTLSDKGGKRVADLSFSCGVLSWCLSWCLSWGLYFDGDELAAGNATSRSTRNVPFFTMKMPSSFSSVDPCCTTISPRLHVRSLADTAMSRSISAGMLANMGTWERKRTLSSRCCRSNLRQVSLKPTGSAYLQRVRRQEKIRLKREHKRLIEGA